MVDDFGQTSVEGIFSCGNVLQIHDLVDNVSLEAEALAAGVTRYLSTGGLEIPRIPLKAGENVRYCLPQHISGKGKTTVSFRPKNPGGRHRLSFTQNGKVIRKKRLLKANPAEMERIEIDTDGLEGSSEIRVDLVAEEQP